MKRITYTSASALAAVVLTLGAVGCSATAVQDKADSAEKAVDQVDKMDKMVNETYEVTYEVTGKSIESITFHDGGGTATEPRLATVDAPTLPWTKTVTLRGIMPAAVSPIAVTDSADLTCKVTHKGKVIAEAEGDAAMAGGCVVASPVAGE
ncbi:MmpS family transport accessory protein [Streptomyces sp. NPDC101733]|uniref:MmpS family transport accessory protein n=1 Tax=unclassified Streptomyces TaxID=2593676 RepID=UPI0037F6B4D6